MRDYLQSLSSALRAQESYALMTDYALATRATPAQARWDQSVLEKFLLWSFIVKTRPLAELNNSDVQDFLSFCNTPPESWISKSNHRFVKEFGVLKTNPEWRPFHSPLRSHGVRRVINRFFGFNSETIGLVLCPPSRPGTPHVNTCSCTDAELSNSSEAKIRGLVRAPFYLPRTVCLSGRSNNSRRLRAPGIARTPCPL